MRTAFRHLPSVVVMAAALFSVAGCRTDAAASAPTTLKLSTGFPNGTWDIVGQALATAYTQRVPNIVTAAKPNGDLEAQADAIESGASDLALEDAETAYVAYSTGTTARRAPHGNIRAIAVLFSTAVQIVARSDSGITRIRELRGRRVDVGQQGTAVERAARLILESHGLSYRSITPIFGSIDPAAALRDGTIDARFFYAPFQQPAINDVVRTVDVRFLPIQPETVASIQEQHHFLKSIVLPAGTYPRQDADVSTLGMDVLLLCGRDLADTLVYRLTAALFDAVPDLRRAHASAAGIDPDRGPTAAVPLHPGAARYYREREILR
jgi:TRAP transporter TAXI family solute receptor